MAMTTTTRRALLGATLSAPIAATILAALAIAQSVSTAEWDAALRTFTAADEAMNAYDRDHLSPVSRAWSDVRSKWPMYHDFANDPEATAELASANVVYDPVQKQFDRLCIAQDRALDALCLTPAPNLAALATKLELIARYEVYDANVGADVMTAVADDARRLGGRA